MAKLFSERIIEQLKKMSLNFNSDDYTEGDKYIYQRNTRSPQKRCSKCRNQQEANEELLYNPQLITPEPKNRKLVTCSITGSPHSSKNLIEKQSQTPSAKRESICQCDKFKKYNISRELRKDSQNEVNNQNRIHVYSVECVEKPSLMRSILGPFPDEILIAAIDKILSWIGIAAGAKPHELNQLGMVQDCAAYLTDYE